MAGVPIPARARASRAYCAPKRLKVKAAPRSTKENPHSMYEHTISTARLVTIGAWALTAVAALAAWTVTIFLSSHHFGSLLGMTACCLSAVAAVGHVRCLIYRATRHIRATVDGVSSAPSSSGLRSL